MDQGHPANVSEHALIWEIISPFSTFTVTSSKGEVGESMNEKGYINNIVLVGCIKE